MKWKRAFSLVEILVALSLVSLLLLSLYQVSRMAHTETMDASYKLTALALAREPLEILRGLGYRELTRYRERPLAAFPLGEISLSDNPVEGRHYPVPCHAFKRHLTVIPVEEGGMKAIRILVRVYPRQSGWLTRQECVLETIVPEDPAW